MLQPFANSNNLYAVQSVICKEIGLSAQSPADVALCKVNSRNQKAEDIVALFEVKMSIVWNWELKNEKLHSIGDYKTHQGNPGLLRSDTMLKAIGKSINIRVSGLASSYIPIFVLGNTPITKSYFSKVDHFFTAGIVQGFWSINPKPLEDDKDPDNLKNTPRLGFIRMDSYDEFLKNLKSLILNNRTFFTGMKTKKELGRIIKIANREENFEDKAEKFLSLIRK